jgi:hypothetical protein
LNQAKFNPKDPGPLNVVAHSSGPSYLEMRSMEFIMEAQIDRGNLRDLKNLIIGGIPTDSALNEDNARAVIEFKNYKQKMLRAIQCLSLAIIKVENGEF